MAERSSRGTLTGPASAPAFPVTNHPINRDGSDARQSARRNADGTRQLAELHRPPSGLDEQRGDARAMFALLGGRRRCGFAGCFAVRGGRSRAGSGLLAPLGEPPSRFLVCGCCGR